MKQLLSKYLPLIPVAVVMGSLFFSNSCANTSQAPSGGQKDTIPPVVVKMSPKNYSTHIPLNDAVFEFTFNEYMVVKDANNIILSPPQTKKPKTKVKGKSLLVSLEEDLLPNTTYTLTMLNAIADNNEGNLLPSFTYVFSTGEQIDSMVLTGTVEDCATLQPLKGISVFLYKDHSDSAIFLHKPYAVAKTDDWGYFSFQFIQDTLYRLYALKDQNSNFIYDPSSLELVGFVDSLVRPQMVASDTLFEILPFDMKDTLNCQARRSEYNIQMFKEINSTQRILRFKRRDIRSAYLSFMTNNAHIDSLWISGIPSDRIISQFNLQRDSLELWINDRRRLPDTLNLYVNYKKTDSTGILVSDTEQVKLYMEKEKENDESKASKSSTKQISHEDTICVYTLTVTPETVETQGFSLEFKNPIINEGFKDIKMISINPREQENEMAFSIIPDTLNLRKFRIKPDETLLQGYEYKLKVPHRRFQDINGYYNDSTEVNVSLPNDDKLSTVRILLTGVKGKYFIDFMNDSKNKVLNSFVVNTDTTLTVPYLKQGEYNIRITEDLNGNSYVDSGSILEHRQPERVFFYTNGESSTIKVIESADIDQEINVTQLFNGKDAE